MHVQTALIVYAGLPELRVLTVAMASTMHVRPMHVRAGCAKVPACAGCQGAIAQVHTSAAHLGCTMCNVFRRREAPRDA